MNHSGFGIILELCNIFGVSLTKIIRVFDVIYKFHPKKHKQIRLTVKKGDITTNMEILS